MKDIKEDVLEYLAYWIGKGRPPGFKAIAKRFCFSSPSEAGMYLRQMASEGLISMEGNLAGKVKILTNEPTNLCTGCQAEFHPLSYVLTPYGKFCCWECEAEYQDNLTDAMAETADHIAERGEG